MIINKASRSLGFICRSLKEFKNLSTHKILYNAYVRSILEYASIIWNPYYHTYTQTIENIQRKFTRLLAYKFNIPRGTYQTRLLALNMTSLYNRRLYFDELFLYKIVSERINLNLGPQFQFYTPFRITRFTPSFYIPSVTSNVEFYSLPLRLKRHHNECFANVDLISNSIHCTKRSIIESLSHELWPNFR